jgi:hypothetical protein
VRRQHSRVAPARGRTQILAACRYCLDPERLKRTVMTALIVGTVLTLLNQADVLAAGEATSITYLKCTANYIVPFVVANAGMLIGRGTP